MPWDTVHQKETKLISIAVHATVPHTLNSNTWDTQRRVRGNRSLLKILPIVMCSFKKTFSTRTENCSTPVQGRCSSVF